MHFLEIHFWHVSWVKPRYSALYYDSTLHVMWQWSVYSDCFSDFEITNHLNLLWVFRRKCYEDVRLLCICNHIMTQYWIEGIWMTPSNENIFRVTGHLCGEFTGHPWIPRTNIQRPVTRSFDVSFDLHNNKRLSKQSWGWWFETPSRSLWRHCNVFLSYLSRKWKTFNRIGPWGQHDHN